MALPGNFMCGIARLSLTVLSGGDGHVKTSRVPGRCKVTMVMRRHQMPGNKMLHECLAWCLCRRWAAGLLFSDIREQLAAVLAISSRLPRCRCVHEIYHAISSHHVQNGFATSQCCIDRRFECHPARRKHNYCQRRSQQHKCQP